MTLTLTPKASADLLAMLRAPGRFCWAVYGLGISGRAMAMALRQHSAQVVGVDDNVKLDTTPFDDAGITLRLGPPSAETFADCDAMAIAPGIDPRTPLITNFLQSERPVLGELCLAKGYKGDILAITGTNGKSTTTALAGALCQGLGHKTFVGGNLGTPFLQVFAEPDAKTAVLELSSYQLETAYFFAPKVGVVLNVTPDHAERYASFDAYADTKAQLVRRVHPKGRVILSYDDPKVRAMAHLAQAPVWWFSTQQSTLPGDGACVIGNRLVPQGAAAGMGEMSLAHPKLLGRHNRENAVAALLAAHAMHGATADAMQAAYLAFCGLEHRLEQVGEVAGVVYINDSKATNDASAAIAVRAMTRPTWLLVGGRDKGGGYALLRAAAEASDAGIRGIVAFGAAAPIITEAFAKSLVPMHTAASMEAALAVARAQAVHGDAVLLSPACSSFDAFTNYMHRGAVFKQNVQSLQKAGA